MNERIRELAVQAGIEFVYDPTETPMRAFVECWEDEMQKFAELIVRECVAQIQPMWDQVQEIGPPGGYDYDTFDLAYNDCMNAIKEHFGVEE